MVMVSVVVTALCRMPQFMPSAWLADVLGRVSDHPASQLQELLPWHWARARRVAHAA